MRITYRSFSKLHSQRLSMNIKHIGLFSLLSLSACTQKLSEQFEPNDTKQNKIFSIQNIQDTVCPIRTLGPVEEKSLKSQAKNIVIEANQQSSLVLPSKKGSVSVINNFPIVDYEVKGSKICSTLLGQRKIYLTALPHSSYKIYFQITGAHLRILMAGFLKSLPYQNLTQKVSLGDGVYAVPVGGYELMQGRVQPIKNVENEDLHIIDFFPNESDLKQNISKKTGLNHWLRQGAESIYIAKLGAGFQLFKFQEKMDVFPKDYFKGVWHSGVSVISADPSSPLGRGSGIIVSGNSYTHKKNLPSGQKIVFQFDSGQLTAVNKNYKSQSESLSLIHQLGAEVLSIPIKHLDYKNMMVEEDGAWSFEEELNSRLSWKERKYVSIDFSKVDDFFRKSLKITMEKYLESPLNYATNERSLKEVRFAPNYFDFVISDSFFEYRFAFVKKEKSNYTPKTLSTLDQRFEFFSLPYNKIFSPPSESFRQDYEEQVRIFRVNPLSDVTLHFSNLTPKNDKIRTIGREAVSLWNQALEKAKVSLRLILDESKDVSVGDNRYHIINMPVELGPRYAGVGQWYADDETGEVIASSSNVSVLQYIQSIENAVINYAYNKYNLRNRLSRIAVDYPQRMPEPVAVQEKNLPYNLSALQYLNLQNHLNRHFNFSLPSVPRSIQKVDSFFQQVKVFRRSFSQLPLPNQLFNFSDNFLDSESMLPNNIKTWLKNFKILYALRYGRFIEDESFDQAQQNIKSWMFERDDFPVYDFNSETMFSKVCWFIESPMSSAEKFKSSVRKCTELIYPIYVLATTVHEIGHSVFSLRHNFSGSSDSDNFSSSGDYTVSSPYFVYQKQNGREISLSELMSPSSSSVMEYSSFHRGEQWAPGPYDTAAIQFLFSEALEESVDENKTAIFRRCSDSDEASTYCAAGDAGHNPKMIALNEIKNLFYHLDSYFYDLDQARDYSVYFYYFYKSLKRLMVIYRDWKLRIDKSVLEHTGSTVEELTEKDWELFLSYIVQRGKRPGASDQDRELLNFYQARNLIYHTLTYLAFLPNRYCVLERGWNHYHPDKPWKPEVQTLLELSKVIEADSLEDKLHVKPILSCWADAEKTKPHPAVEKYMSRHYPSFSLKDEFGHFLYSRKIPKDAPFKGMQFISSYKGAFHLRLLAFGALSMTGGLFSLPIKNNNFVFSMMNDPDIEKAIRRLFLARITRGVFYPQEGFFDSIAGRYFEDITPEKSAEILFEFPKVSDKPDPIFRDEFVQPEKLVPGTPLPQKRDDRHKVKFYPNFVEERRLLTLWSQYYTIGHLTAGGLSQESFSERQNELFSDIGVDFSLTSFLLSDKAIKYSNYSKHPHLSALYYFELDNLLILPSEMASLDTFGNILLSELARNSVKFLWTKPSSLHFIERVEPDEGIVGHGFSAYLLDYLREFVWKYQGTRLGRFYFMYAYLISLQLLEAYEYVLNFSNENSQMDIHEEAGKLTRSFEKVIHNLFYVKICDYSKLLIPFANNLRRNSIEKVNPETGLVERRPFRDGTERAEYRRQFVRDVFINCPDGGKRPRGKMQSLFIDQELLLNLDKANHLFRWPVKELHESDLLPRPMANMLLNRLNTDQFFNDNKATHHLVQSMESHLHLQGGIESVALIIKGIFRKLFPANREPQLVKKWIHSNRQILIDVLPKMLMMYSQDRNFVGEMMLLMTFMHDFCFYSNASEFQCNLIVEKFIGHYFRRSDYGEDPELEKAFFEIYTGRKEQAEYGGIPKSLLLKDRPKNILDYQIHSLPFRMDVLSDFLFYERPGWDALNVNVEELSTQQDIIFSLLPLGRVRVLDSSLFYKGISLITPEGVEDNSENSSQ